MLSTLAAARHMLAKRIAADWLILSAALVILSLATILLAAGPMYADAMTLSALQQTTADAPVRETSINIGQNIPPDLYDLSDQLVVGSVDEAFASTGADVSRRVSAESFEIPNQASDDSIRLVSFQAFDEFDKHASLIDGKWPDDATAQIETVVLASTAEMLELGVGDVLAVTNRRDKTFQRTVLIVGLYEVDDDSDPFWFDDPLMTGGVTEQVGFRTFGPLVVTHKSMVNQLTRDRLIVSWRVFPQYENLTAPEVGHLRSRVSTIEEQLNIAFVEMAGADGPAASEFEVGTGLPLLLASTQRSLTVTRSSVLAILVQLAILAGYALVLTAGLLVDVRRTETNLLRSRGTSPGQLLTIAVLEGILLTVPVALAAPWLASMALEILNDLGPISFDQSAIEPRPTVEAYILSALAALAAVVALSWPAYRSAKRFPDPPGESRQGVQSGIQRVGVDLALAALAVVAFWQLQSLGSRIGATVRGRFGVDPLLVVAPALGLLAGAILALRIVPLIARMAERVASAGRTSVLALAAWQVARRPIRYARSSLLLIMAIGIGFFAAAFSMTWEISQIDQAEFQAGADLRLLPNRRTNDAVADIYLPTAHEQLDFVEASMPVFRESAQLARFGSNGQFIFVDARRSNEIVQIRDDLAPDFEDLMAELVTQRPTMGSVPLPGEPVRIGLSLIATENWPQTPDRHAPNALRPGFDLGVSAIIQDGDGLLHKVRLGSIPLNVGPSRLEGALTHTLADGTVAVPRFPLALVDIEVHSPIPDGMAHEPTVTLTGIHVLNAEAGWVQVQTSLGSDHWDISRNQVAGALIQPTIKLALDQPSDMLVLTINTGAWARGPRPPLYFSIRPAGTVLPETLPIIVTHSFLESNASTVGESLRLPVLLMGSDEAEIVGTVVAFPTVDSTSTETIVVDLPTFQMMTYGPGESPDNVSEFWMSVTGDTESEVESKLLGPNFDSVRVIGRNSRTVALTSDPVARGTIGVLSLGFVAATVFATVGLATTATVSARARMREFALLRALGLSPRQLTGWLALEQGMLVVVSLSLGTLVGFLLTAFVLPHVALTQAGANPVPDVIVVFPWRAVLQLELAVLALLGTVVLIMTVLLRRLGLGSLLRSGDD